MLSNKVGGKGGSSQGSSWSGTDWALVCLWEVGSDCLCITCLEIFPLSSHIQLSQSQPTSFFRFCYSDSLPHTAGYVGESELVTGWVFSC